MEFLSSWTAGQLARILVMYFFVIVMLRIAGKRRLAHLSTSDIIIIIALGSAVGDVLIYPQSVVQLEFAMLAVASIIILQIVMTKLSEKNRFFSYLFEGKRTLLVRNGQKLAKNLDDEDISDEDLEEMLAEKGVPHVSYVKEAYLERSGEFSVFLKPIARKIGRHFSRKKSRHI